MAWSRSTGKPLCNAIVWDDSRTKNTVAHYEQKLQTVGIEVIPGIFNKGTAGVEALREMLVSNISFITPSHLENTALVFLCLPTSPLSNCDG